jgi:hypothetical protein
MKTIDTEHGDHVAYDSIHDSLSVRTRHGAVIQIGFADGAMTIRTEGDIEMSAGGMLRLKGDQGVKIDGGGDVRLASSEETIIRGKMVRIN